MFGPGLVRQLVVGPSVDAGALATVSSLGCGAADCLLAGAVLYIQCLDCAGLAV